MSPDTGMNLRTCESKAPACRFVMACSFLALRGGSRNDFFTCTTHFPASAEGHGKPAAEGAKEARDCEFRHQAVAAD
jgi:hypothetical protein